MFKENGQQKVIEGIIAAADIVGSTMGPFGKKVILSADQQKGAVRDTMSRDGVTVARRCQNLFTSGEDDFQFLNIGTRLLVNSADSTVKAVGDGTTTTSVMVRDALKAYLEKKVDPINLKGDADQLIAAIKDNSREVDLETLKKMTTISANNNKELGEMIAEKLADMGYEGVGGFHFSVEVEFEEAKEDEDAT